MSDKKFSFADESDPNAKAGEFPVVPAGDYICGKIEFNEAESGWPEFRTDRLNRRVAYSHLKTTDEKWDIFYSGTKSQYLLLARAYEVEVTPLTKLIETEFLVKLEEAINKSGKTVKVVVNDRGFISAIPGAELPEGIYRWKFVDARTPDGSEPLTFQPHRFSKGKDGKEDESKYKIYLIFELAGDMLGKPTPYDGYRLMLDFKQPFDGSKDGEPKFRVNPNKSKPVEVIRLERFVNIFCPEVFEHELQTDPMYSDYGVNEVEYPMTVIVDHAKKAGRLGVGMYSKTSPKATRMSIDLMTMQAVNGEDEPEESEETEVNEADMIAKLQVEHPNLMTFCEWINQQVSGGAFEQYPITSLDNMKLSKEGREWTGMFLLDTWEKSGLPFGERKLSSLTEDEALKLCVAAGIEAVKEEEKSEFPFS